MKLYFFFRTLKKMQAIDVRQKEKRMQQDMTQRKERRRMRRIPDVVREREKYRSRWNANLRLHEADVAREREKYQRRWNANLAHFGFNTG
jgi:hypothetical protein